MIKENKRDLLVMIVTFQVGYAYNPRINNLLRKP